MEFTGWEPREDLLRGAHDAGFGLSGPQLGRLHRAGLIPAPKIRSLGRGRGTVSEFPPGSTRRLLRVLQLREDTRSLGELGWRLWWEDGCAPPPAVRALLGEQASAWEHQRAEFGALLAGEDAGELAAIARMESIYRGLEDGRVDGPLGPMRRRTGRSAFASVVRVFAEILTGRFQGFTDVDGPASDGTPAPESTAQLVEVALGINRARRDRLANTAPWFQGRVETDLLALSRTLGRVAIVPYAECSEAELDAARTELRAFLATIAAIVPVFEQLFGANAFGLATIGRALQIDDPSTQALSLLGWLVMREDPKLSEAMRRFGALAPVASASAGLYRVLGELGEQVPAFASVTSDSTLARMQRDAATAARVRTEMRELFAQNREAVDAFAAAHPEIAGMLAAVENANEPGAPHPDVLGETDHVPGSFTEVLAQRMPPGMDDSGFRGR